MVHMRCRKERHKQEHKRCRSRYRKERHSKDRPCSKRCHRKERHSLDHKELHSWGQVHSRSEHSASCSEGDQRRP